MGAGPWGRCRTSQPSFSEGAATLQCRQAPQAWFAALLSTWTESLASHMSSRNPALDLADACTACLGQGA